MLAALSLGLSLFLPAVFAAEEADITAGDLIQFWRQQGLPPGFIAAELYSLHEQTLEGYVSDYFPDEMVRGRARRAELRGGAGFRAGLDGLSELGGRGSFDSRGLHAHLRQ